MIRELGNFTPKAHGAAEIAWKRITYSYILALSLIATTVVISGWLLADAIHVQANYASLINRAGAQRMLSQRTAALIGAHSDPAAMTALAQVVQKMKASHLALSEGANAPARETPELAAHYFGGSHPLDREVRDFLANLASFESYVSGHQDVEGLVASIRAEALGPLLINLDGAVKLYEAAAQANVGTLITYHRISLCMALFLLATEAVFIFRPLATKVAALARRLQNEANLDPLTNLLNRRAIAENLRNIGAANAPVAIIAVDLDWFKETNEAEGHQVGDWLLQVTSKRIGECVRATDIVGRVGGDEFIVLLIGVDNWDIAERTAKRISQALHRSVAYDGRMLRLAATLGVALAPIDAATPELALRAANDALNHAKQVGRGSIGRAMPGCAARLGREAALLRAFDTEEDVLPGLTAYLQPIVSLGGPIAPISVTSFEALARWSHPDLGPVLPEEFLPAALRCGRMPWLSGQVRAAAMRIFANLRKARFPAPRLAFNLSAAELMRGDVVQLIESDVQAAGLTLSCIEIEITEEILLDRIDDKTLDQLAALRGRGARLSLDDFGTGNSGLAQLLRLPLDTVKLDKTFVQRLNCDRRAVEIVRATLLMGQSLDIEIIAEGVETQEQAEVLYNLGCRSVQGFLFARPMPERELRLWLAAQGSPKDNKIIPIRGGLSLI